MKKNIKILTIGYNLCFTSLYVDLALNGAGARHAVYKTLGWVASTLTQCVPLADRGHL